MAASAAGRSEQAASAAHSARAGAMAIRRAGVEKGKLLRHAGVCAAQPGRAAIEKMGMGKKKAGLRWLPF